MRSFQLRGLCAAIALGFCGALASAPALAADARVIVKFKAGALAKGKAEIARQRGKVVLELSEVDALAARLSPAAIAALRKSPLVEFVETDHLQYAIGRTPSAGNRNAELAETVPYGITLTQANQISDSAAGGRTLCIVDSGIDGTHPDLQGLPKNGENLTTSGTWDSDESGHGTHVAGTVAAVGGNGIGVVGVAPNRKLNLYIAKVFDASGSTASSTVAKAMLACSKNGHANVISMSLGGSSPSQLQQVVVKLLNRRGVLLIAAAGNAGTSAISYPAGFTEVMSVAGVDALKNKYTGSQFNADVEIAAPAVGVLSTVPVGTGSEYQATVGSAVYSVTKMAGDPPGNGSPALIRTAALYNFGLGTAVDAGASGKVCLIQRGSIAFSEKVLNCQNSGGVAAIVYNNAPGPLNGTLGTAVTTIPSIGATDTDGADMLTKVGQSATVDTVNETVTDYAYFDGTSMATPHVSSIASVVWSQHQTCTHTQIRDSLKNSAMDLGAVGRDDIFGNGLVQAKAASDRITSMGCGN